MVPDVLLTEVLGEAATEHFIKMFARVSKFLCSGEFQRVVGYVYNSLKVRHFVGIDDGRDDVADEEQFRLAVVHYVVNLFSIEFVEDRNGDSTVGEGCHKCYCPV